MIDNVKSLSKVDKNHPSNLVLVQIEQYLACKFDQSRFN